MCGAVALMHALMARRVGTPSPASKVGSLASQPSTPCPPDHARVPVGPVHVRRVEAGLPLGVLGLAAGDAAAVEVEHRVGHPERLVGREAEDLLGDA